MKVFITVLLLMTFDLLAAQHLRTGSCPPCKEGYFVVANCSFIDGRNVGVQCRQCTDCSAAHQDMLVQCSTFTDSQCGNKNNNTPEPLVSAPGSLIVLSLTISFLFLVLLISLFVTLLAYRNHRSNKLKGLDHP